MYWDVSNKILNSLTTGKTFLILICDISLKECPIWSVIITNKTELYKQNNDRRVQKTSW